jgi:hypothetical protein
MVLDQPSLVQQVVSLQQVKLHAQNSVLQKLVALMTRLPQLHFF